MDQNQGAEKTSRLMELYDSAKTGSIGVANDWKRFDDLVAEIEADSELKDDVVGNLNARGLSLTKVKEKVVSGRKIRDAIVAEYPNAIPEPAPEV